MNIRLLPIFFCLTGCSTVTFKDVPSTDNSTAPIVENRTKKSNSSVKVQVVPNDKVEVKKVDILKRPDPNIILQDYLI